MAHSNQIREFILTNQGVSLREVYIGQGGVLTGSARLAQEAVENAEVLARKNEIERRQRELEQKRKALEAQIESLHSIFKSEEMEALKIIETEQTKIDRFELEKTKMAASRKVI